MTVLFVSGEASGDRIAAGIAAQLPASARPLFGIGGPASEAAGIELVARIEDLSAMGGVEVLGRLPRLARAHRALARATALHRPRLAVLVNFSEYTTWLGKRLRQAGLFVLQCVAPQVWAWRPGRVARVREAVDRLAVILPFEEPLWRAAGVNARYVGHPALDAVPLARSVARAELGLGPDAKAVAILPGSRPHEVRRLALEQLAGLRLASRVVQRSAARVFVSPALDPETRGWLERAAEAHEVPTVRAGTSGAAPWLRAFDAAIVASGTATLECALAGAHPVIVYRTSKTTWAIARRSVRIPHVALPNIVLGRGAYPELLQDAATPEAIARALEGVLTRAAELAPLAEELRATLEADGGAPRCRSAVERVATLLPRALLASELASPGLLGPRG